MRSLTDYALSGARGRPGDDPPAALLLLTFLLYFVQYVVQPVAVVVVVLVLVRIARRRRAARLRAGDTAYAGADECKSRGSMGVPLCGCMERPSVCLMGCCAPCCLAGMSMAESQGRSWTLWDWMFPSQFATRQAIRQELNLPRDGRDATRDCAEVVCCAPCVACQHHTYYCNKYERGDYGTAVEFSSVLLQPPPPAGRFSLLGGQSLGVSGRDAARKGSE